MNISKSWQPWGAEPLQEVPGLDEIAGLAATVKRTVGQRVDSSADLRALCGKAGAQVRLATLGGRDGGREAMLAPLPGDRFGISVDPTPREGWRSIPRQLRPELKRHRTRFRIGHELAHTFFYARGAEEPRRHLFDSPPQEEFCDAFARELLVPQRGAARTDPSPAGILRLRARCDVSLELAVRAAAAARPKLEVALWFVPPDDEPKLQWANLPFHERACDPGPPDRSSPSVKWLAGRRQLLLVA